MPCLLDDRGDEPGADHGPFRPGSHGLDSWRAGHGREWESVGPGRRPDPRRPHRRDRHPPRRAGGRGHRRLGALRFTRLHRCPFARGARTGFGRPESRRTAPGDGPDDRIRESRRRWTRRSGPSEVRAPRERARPQCGATRSARFGPAERGRESGPTGHPGRDGPNALTRSGRNGGGRVGALVGHVLRAR